MLFVCPLCKKQLNTDSGKSAVCPSGHSFDKSRKGYYNLLIGRGGAHGDNKEMVIARRAFLERGLYEPLASFVAESVAELIPFGGAVLDAGCGEGYYTSILAQSGYTCLGFDLSKAAVDAASKRIARTECGRGFFGVGSVFEMPLNDASCAGIVNIFAPCAEEEFARVLALGGILIVAYAGPEHLMGLKKAIYETTKENDMRADLPNQLTKIDEVRVHYSISVKTEAQIQNLFAMTPYYWRTSPADADKLKGLDELTTDVDMIFSVYRKDK